MIVGLTGGLASGKSTVESILHEHFAFNVIDCDKVALQLLTENDVIDFIVTTFGQEMLDANKLIDKPKLANVVFSNDIKRKQLEAIIHPKVIFYIEQQIRNARLALQHLIVSAPLFIEANMQSMVDVLITCECGTALQISHALNRGMNYNDIQARLAAQLKPEARIFTANHVIWNNHSIDQLSKKSINLIIKLFEL